MNQNHANLSFEMAIFTKDSSIWVVRSCENPNNLAGQHPNSHSWFFKELTLSLERDECFVEAFIIIFAVRK